MARMTADQRRALQSRISELYGWAKRQPAAEAARLPDTPEVRSARALVKKFDAANAKREDKVEERYRKAERDAREAVMFREPAEAYAFVMALKELKP